MKNLNSDDPTNSAQQKSKKKQWRSVYLGKKAKVQLDELSRKYGLHRYQIMQTAVEMFEGNADGSLHVNIPVINHNIVTLERSIGMLCAQVDHMEELTRLLIETAHDQQELT